MLPRRGYRKSGSETLQMEEEVRSLSEQNYRIEEECRDLAAQVRELKTQCDSVESALEESRREKDELLAQHDSLPGRETFRELAAEADHLRESESQALSELTSVRENAEKLRQESTAKAWKTMHTEEQARKASQKLKEKVKALEAEVEAARDQGQQHLREALVFRQELSDAKEALVIEQDRARGMGRGVSEIGPPGMNGAGTGESLFDQLNLARNPDLLEEIEELQEQLEKAELLGQQWHNEEQQETKAAMSFSESIAQCEQLCKELESSREADASEAAENSARLQQILDEEARALADTEGSLQREQEEAALLEKSLRTSTAESEAKEESQSFEVTSLQDALSQRQQLLEDEQSRAAKLDAALEETAARSAQLEDDLQRLLDERRQSMQSLEELESEVAQRQSRQEQLAAAQEEELRQALEQCQGLQQDLHRTDESLKLEIAQHERTELRHLEAQQEWRASEQASAGVSANLRAELAVAEERGLQMEVLEEEQRSEAAAWSQSWAKLKERHKVAVNAEEMQQSTCEHLAANLRSAHEEQRQLEETLKQAASDAERRGAELHQQREVTARLEKDEEALEERAATLAASVREAIADMRARKASHEVTEASLAQEELRSEELEEQLSFVEARLDAKRQAFDEKDRLLRSESWQVQEIRSELDWHVNEAQMYQRLRDETLGAELASLKLERLQDELFPHNRAVLSSLAKEESSEDRLKADVDAEIEELQRLRENMQSADAARWHQLLRQRLFFGLLSRSFGNTVKRTSSNSPSRLDLGSPPLVTSPRSPLSRPIGLLGNLTPRVETPQKLLSPRVKAPTTDRYVLLPAPVPEVPVRPLCRDLGSPQQLLR
mmetsp:Transcript_73021/g.173961  ORF Transcript_73021/g.173961 Transcript_73021/m.173961 type:complete len:846 (+) Transcript_73021:264-2801(+)